MSISGFYGPIAEDEPLLPLGFASGEIEMIASAQAVRRMVVVVLDTCNSLRHCRANNWSSSRRGLSSEPSATGQPKSWPA